MYAVIMASGQGTRLWPLSRQNKPKQFHSLLGSRTLIQDTFDRLSLKFKPENIFVTVTEECVDDAKDQLPLIPDENFVVEPYATGTTGTCIVAIQAIAKKDPKATAIFVPSDHIVKEPKEFIKIVDFSEEMVEKYPDHVVLIGINPTRPDTGMGYIQMNSQIEANDELKAFSVKRFVEKPNEETAKKYVALWEYLWNGGIFVWKTNHILDLYQKLAAKTYRASAKIAEFIGKDDYLKIAKKEYPSFDKISIDYSIMEKTKDILVVPGDFGWSDVGSWGTLLDVLLDSYGSEIITKGHHIGVDNKNCLVLAGQKLIATVGLEDIVVVDTPDALLICKGDKSQEVKDLIDKIKAEGKNLYL